VIQSAPENYFEVITPIRFQVPPDLKLIRVESLEYISLFDRIREQVRIQGAQELLQDMILGAMKRARQALCSSIHP
jgi:hypothetical protein